MSLVSHSITGQRIHFGRGEHHRADAVEIRSGIFIGSFASMWKLQSASWQTSHHLVLLMPFYDLGHDQYEVCTTEREWKIPRTIGAFHTTFGSTGLEDAVGTAACTSSSRDALPSSRGRVATYENDRCIRRALDDATLI